MVAMPTDVLDLDPNGTIYKQVGDKIQNPDGLTAYQLDKDSQWLLVQLKYGNWDPDGNPADVFLDGLECVKKETPCAVKQPFPLYQGWEGYRTNTVSTGALDRVPLLDPSTGEYLGTIDRVWLKTQSKNGSPILFPFEVQMISNDDPNNSLGETDKLLAYHLQTGDSDSYNERKHPIAEVTKLQLSKFYSSGVKLSLALLDQFPPDNDLPPMQLADPGVAIIKGSYASPLYNQSLKPFFDSLSNNDRIQALYFSITVFNVGFWVTESGNQ